MTLDYATPTAVRRTNPIVYWATVGLAILSIALIYIGGLVTSYGAGMSVPDWPATNGYCMFAFPISKWVGGILYEHSHRLYASGVGFYTLVLCGIVFYTDRRKWVRWFALALLLAVAIQGTLGGLRVVWSKLDLAIVHGCAGQVFLCMVGTFAVLTSRFWADAPNMRNATSRLLLVLSAVASTVVLVQLIIGAIMRHKQAGLAIPDFPLAFGLLLPPTHIDDHIQHLALRYGTNLGPDGVTLFMVWIHFAHRLWAVVVSAVLVVLAAVLLQRKRDVPLAGSAWVLLALLATQLTLGILTVLLRRPADITSLHVAVGSVTLLQTWIITLKCWRLHHGANGQ